MSLLSLRPSSASRQLWRQSTSHSKPVAVEARDYDARPRKYGLARYTPEAMSDTDSIKYCQSRRRALESHFIQCLVQAGRCRPRTSLHTRTCYEHPVAQQRQYIYTDRQAVQSFRTIQDSHVAIEDAGQSCQPSMTKEELKSLLDYYIRPRNLHTEAQPPPKTHDHLRTPSISPVTPEPDHTRSIASQEDTEALNILQGLVDDRHSSHDAIQTALEAISMPRISKLPKDLRHDLLHRLSNVERTPTEMLRFLSLVSEIRDAGLPLTLYEWTTATFFTGRYLHLISDLSVERAFLMWREMESQAGIQSSGSTMTVLFNIAVKARKFVLAEMILEEIERRALPKQLHFRTSLIYYYGIRRDSRGIRESYQELVDAGEVVSTPVITCVIAALLLCGEPIAAEHVFERAKRLHAESSGRPLPPTTWKDRRKLGKVLRRAAKGLQGDKEALRSYQSGVAIAPGIEAYRCLIHYHAFSVGDLDRTSQLINEMSAHGIPVTGSFFVILFKAFAVHGGIIYTSWTSRKLEDVWNAFWDAQEETPSTHYLSRTSVTHALKAYSKCVGLHRVQDVWSQILGRWDPSEEDQAAIESLIQQLAEGDDTVLTAVETNEVNWEYDLETDTAVEDHPGTTSIEDPG